MAVGQCAPPPGTYRVNKLIYLPKVNTTTYGIDSIRYQCAKLWDNYFKYGKIFVDDDKTNEPKITNKKMFNWTLKGTFFTLIPLYQLLFFTDFLVSMVFPI